MGLRAGDFLTSFLGKADFPKPRLLEIRGVEAREVEGQRRLLLHFAQEPRSMLLNKTCIKVLRESFGDDCDRWRGQLIVGFIDPSVEYGGRRVGGLRLRLPRSRAQQASPAPREPQAGSRESVLDASGEFFQGEEPAPDGETPF